MFAICKHFTQKCPIMSYNVHIFGHKITPVSVTEPGLNTFVTNLEPIVLVLCEDWQI